MIITDQGHIRINKEEHSMRTSYIIASSGRDSLEYYLECDRRRYYLFSTRFDYWLFDYFKSGVQLQHIFSGSRNPQLSHLKERLIKAVRYVEAEHRLNVLAKNISNRKKRSAAYYPYDEDIA